MLSEVLHHVPLTEQMLTSNVDVFDCLAQRKVKISDHGLWLNAIVHIIKLRKDPLIVFRGFSGY